MKGYLRLRKQVLEDLKSNLPEELTYHGVDHTLDVLHVCNQYIRRENLPAEERYLLRIGAVVHDMGFLKGPKNHEETGAEMASKLMRKSGFPEAGIELVQGLVLATKIPQSPQTPLQRIICDADLDYLGRKDYPEISQKLLMELRNMKVISTQEQWRELQIDFLRKHRFHTPFAQQYREPQKQVWLNKLLVS